MEQALAPRDAGVGLSEAAVELMRREGMTKDITSGEINARVHYSLPSLLATFQSKTIS